MAQDWRDTVRASELEYWENVHRMQAAVADRADRDGVTYEYTPWYNARGRQEFVGKVACVAYWTHAAGSLPWGHQHAHTYAFAFKRITGIGADWITFEGDDTVVTCTYDTLCVQTSR